MIKFQETLTPMDTSFHKRLVGKIDAADQLITQAHSALSKANQAHAAALSGMSAWMEELQERYGLKDNDLVDRDGKLHYIDPAWRAILEKDAAESDGAIPDGPAADVPPDDQEPAPSVPAAQTPPTVL